MKNDHQKLVKFRKIGRFLAKKWMFFNQNSAKKRPELQKTSKTDLGSFLFLYFKINNIK